MIFLYIYFFIFNGKDYGKQLLLISYTSDKREIQRTIYKVMFTENVDLYYLTSVFLHLLFIVHYNYTGIRGFIPVLSIRIGFNCFICLFSILRISQLDWSVVCRKSDCRPRYSLHLTDKYVMSLKYLFKLKHSRVMFYLFQTLFIVVSSGKLKRVKCVPL